MKIETPEVGDEAVAGLYLLVIGGPFLELAVFADFQRRQEGAE